MLNTYMWLTVIFTSAIVSAAITLPIRIKLRGIESMLEMLRKMITGKYDDIK